MIVVTGANGQLGRGVVEALLERGRADGVIATVRDPKQAQDLTALGVQVRVGDFDHPAGLAVAFADAAQVLIVSVNRLGSEALEMHRAAIRAARAAGASRVLYTSHMAARSESPFAPAMDHAATEALLAEGPDAFTSLRHGFYAESALHMIGSGLRDGEMRLPADGPVSWTARTDLAEADAAVLADDGCLDGVSPPLTAAEAVTMADIAAIASGLTGREIKRVVISDEEWRDGWNSGAAGGDAAGNVASRPSRRLRSRRSHAWEPARSAAADHARVSLGCAAAWEIDCPQWVASGSRRRAGSETSDPPTACD